MSEETDDGIFTSRLDSILNSIKVTSPTQTYGLNNMNNNPIGMATTFSNSTITTGGYSVTNGTTYGINWSPSIYSSTITATSSPYTVSTPSSTLSVSVDADFQGKVSIKGKYLIKTLEDIEARLAILHPNPQLEEKWEELKALGDRYRELEKEIIEKESIWSILKK